MTDEEALITLGALLRQAREDAGQSRREAAEIAGIAAGTLSGFELGQRLPNKGTLMAIESAYGWRLGSIAEIWEVRHGLDAESITPALLAPTPVKPPAPKSITLTRAWAAADLTDAELLAELSFRVLMRDTREDQDQ